MSEDKPKTSAITPDQFFKIRFIKLMKDLGQNASKDPETIWLIGSLAGSIVEENQQKSWPEFKLSLSKEGFGQLLGALKSQGQRMAKDKKHKSAYAIETLAISLIAPTMNKDEHIIAGNKLLDKMIGDAINFYRKQPASMRKPN